MLIRCMLRVNPDRRADITAIASHWWLNYDENLPCICDLEENKVLCKAPFFFAWSTIQLHVLGAGFNTTVHTSRDSHDSKFG